MSSSLVFRSKGLILRPFFVYGHSQNDANRTDYQQNTAYRQILPAVTSEERRTLIVACSRYKPEAVKMHHRLGFYALIHNVLRSNRPVFPT
jgi:hypothetical protein